MSSRIVFSPSVGGRAYFIPACSALAIAAALLLNPPQLAAQSGTWTQPVPGGLWSASGNWSGGTIANGSGNTADFSTLNLTTAVGSLGADTVHLDSSRTMGALIFGDTSTRFSWTLDNNGSSANTLTLAAGGAPTITVNNASATISLILAGNQGFTTAGPGTLYLTNSGDTYSGDTTISAGTLNIAADGVLGTTSANPNITFSGNSTLQFGGSFALSSSRNVMINSGITGTLDTMANSVSYGGVISGGSGTSGLSVVSTGGAGFLSLNGAAVNTYTGPTTLLSGTLLLDFSNLATPTNLINSGSALSLNGGTLSINDKSGAAATLQTFNGTTVSPGATSINVSVNSNTNAGSTLALGGFTRSVAGGTANFTLPAVGSITTSTGNSNSILGGWATVGGLNWATNSAGAIAALATYQNDSFASTANNVNITTSDSPGSANVNSLRFNTALTSAGGATLTLPSGTTTIGSGGILLGAGTGALGATITGGTNLTSGSADVVINQYNANGALVLASAINGAVGLTKSGPGTLFVSTAQSYTGATNIDQGAVYEASASNLPGAFTFSGSGALQLNINAPFSHNFIAGAGGAATIDWVGGANIIYSGAISGSGGLTYMSSIGNPTFSDRLDLQGSTQDTYTGPTTIYDGNVTVVVTSGITKINPNNVLNLGGSLNLSDASTVTQAMGTYTSLIPYTSSHIMGLGATGSKFYFSTVSSNGLVRGAGSTLNFDLGVDAYFSGGSVSNANGIIGGWVVGNGTDWAAIGSTGLVAALASYASDTWASGNNTTVIATSHTTDALSTNSLRFNSTSASTLTLSSSSSAAPNVIASGGILVSSNVGAVNNTITGGFLTSGNGSDLIINQFNTTGSLAISSAITNNGATSIGLTLGGNVNATGGTLILSGANTYSGPTAITATTTLQAGAANVIPQTSPVNFSMWGTLNLAGFNQSVGSLSGSSYGSTVTTTTTATLTIGNDNTNATYNGSLRNGTGALALVKVGTGTETLGNYAGPNGVYSVTLQSNYSGGTTIDGGTIAVSSDPNLGAVPGSATPGALVINGTSGAPSTLQAIGTFTLNANRGIALGSATAGTGGTFDVTVNNTLSYPGVITNNGGTNNLTLVDSGTLALSGVNTYSGLTTIAAGTLKLVSGGTNNISPSSTIDVKSGALLDVTQVTGSGGFTLSAGQILKGKGNINGSTTVASTSHLDPGESVGTLIGSALVTQTGSVMDYEFNNSPANDFFQSTNTNGLTVNGGGFNLYQEGTLTAFDTPGTYHLFGYAGTLQGPSGISAAGPNSVLNATLSVLNPQGGFTYTFSNNTALDDVDLTITPVPEPTSVALALLGAIGLTAIARRRRAG